MEHQQRQEEELQSQHEQQAAASARNHLTTSLPNHHHHLTSLLPHVLELKTELADLRNDIKREKESSLRHKSKRSHYPRQHWAVPPPPPEPALFVPSSSVADGSRFHEEMRAAYLAVAASELQQHPHQQYPSQSPTAFPVQLSPRTMPFLASVEAAAAHTASVPSTHPPLPSSSSSVSMYPGLLQTQLVQEKRRNEDITKLAEALGSEVRTLKAQIEAQNRLQEEDAAAIRRLNMDNERAQKDICGLEGQLQTTKEKMDAEVVSKMRLADERDELKQHCSHWKGQCKRGRLEYTFVFCLCTISLSITFLGGGGDHIDGSERALFFFLQKRNTPVKS